MRHIDKMKRALFNSFELLGELFLFVLCLSFFIDIQVFLTPISRLLFIATFLLNFIFEIIRYDKKE